MTIEEQYRTAKAVTGQWQPRIPLSFGEQLSILMIIASLATKGQAVVVRPVNIEDL